MKKKMIILLLTLGILGTAMGCGEKKDKTEDKEGTKTEQSAQEDFKLTNKDFRGNPVARCIFPCICGLSQGRHCHVRTSGPGR